MPQEANGDFLGFGDSTPCVPCITQPGETHLHSGDGDRKKTPEKNQGEKKKQKQPLTKTGAGHNANDTHRITIEPGGTTVKSQLKAEHISSVYPPLSHPKHQTMGHPIIHPNSGMGKAGGGQVGLVYPSNSKLYICIGLGVGLIILALTILGIWSSGTMDHKFKKIKIKVVKAKEFRPDDPLPADTVPLIDYRT